MRVQPVAGFQLWSVHSIDVLPVILCSFLTPLYVLPSHYWNRVLPIGEWSLCASRPPSIAETANTPDVFRGGDGYRSSTPNQAVTPAREVINPYQGCIATYRPIVCDIYPLSRLYLWQMACQVEVILFPVPLFSW